MRASPSDHLTIRADLLAYQARQRHVQRQALKRLCKLIEEKFLPFLVHFERTVGCNFCIVCCFFIIGKDVTV